MGNGRDVMKTHRVSSSLKKSVLKISYCSALLLKISSLLFKLFKGVFSESTSVKIFRMRISSDSESVGFANVAFYFMDSCNALWMGQFTRVWFYSFIVHVIVEIVGNF